MGTQAPQNLHRKVIGMVMVMGMGMVMVMGMGMVMVMVMVRRQKGDDCL